jgi:hypothetical protein
MQDSALNLLFTIDEKVLSSRQQLPVVVFWLCVAVIAAAIGSSAANMKLSASSQAQTQGPGVWLQSK